MTQGIEQREFSRDDPDQHIEVGRTLRVASPVDAEAAPWSALQVGERRLGFGCSGLMARLNRAESLRLLEIAFESGISHFDVARSYGYGEAESAVGAFLAGRREQVTVATKVGILPPRRSPLLAAARLAARQAAALHPGLRRRLRGRAASMVQGGAFDPPSVRASVETSLRELKVERVDLLFLHDCGIGELERSELIELLDRFRAEGKITCWGIATDAKVVREALIGPRRKPAVVQFESSAWDRNAMRLPDGHGAAILTHSALGSRFADLCSQLAADDAMTRAWSRQLGVDAHDRDALAALFLDFALRDNPRGLVLFSSSRVSAIRSNVARVTAAPDVVLDTLGSLVADATHPSSPRPGGRRA